jgi:hypothetical protein
MLSEVGKTAMDALALRSNGLACVAEQVEHLPLPKLQKANLNIALLVSLFVFLIEIGEPNDKEDARVSGQADRSFDSGDWIEGCEEQQLVYVVFVVFDKAS